MRYLLNDLPFRFDSRGRVQEPRTVREKSLRLSVSVPARLFSALRIAFLVPSALLREPWRRRTLCGVRAPPYRSSMPTWSY